MYYGAGARLAQIAVACLLIVLFGQQVLHFINQAIPYLIVGGIAVILSRRYWNNSRKW